MNRHLGAAVAAGAVVVVSALSACSSLSAHPTASPCAPASGVGEIAPDPRARIDSSQLALSPDGTRIAAGCTGATCVWDTSTGTVSMRLADGSHPSWSPDGGQLSIATPTAEIVTFDSHSGAELHRMAGHQAATGATDTASTITGLAYRPDGKVLVSVGTDCTIRTWNAHDGTAQDTITINTGQATGIAMDPTGERIAVTSIDQDASLWSLTSRSLLKSFPDAPPYTYGAAFDRTGRSLALGSGDPINAARIFDADSGKITATAPVTGGASAVVFSPDGAMLAYARPQVPDVVLWNLDTSATLQLSGFDNGVYALVFSPDGSTLYTASSYDGIISWDTTDGTVRTRFELPQ